MIGRKSVFVSVAAVGLIVPPSAAAREGEHPHVSIGGRTPGVPVGGGAR